MPEEPSILFFTRSMTYGGAQRQLSVLARGLKRTGWRVGVAVFYGGGPLESELAAAGIDVFDLQKRGRWDMLGFMVRLIGVLRTFRPQILHSYLTGPNVIAAAAHTFTPDTKLVWGFRASLMDMGSYDFAARLSYRFQRLLASRPDLIISNSERGLRDACDMGYPQSRLVAVSNGIDVDRFRPDPAGRARIRTEYSIDDDTILVGCIARLDPKKDHETLIQAYAQLQPRTKKYHLILIGDDVSNRRQALMELAATLNIGDQVTFVAAQNELSAWYSALDIHCLTSSFGEGFPNVVGEAMACGTPCVVTDCGDAAMIVGDTGAAVRPKEPAQTAKAIEGLEISDQIRQACRQRIAELFSEQHLILGSARILASLITHSARKT